MEATQAHRGDNSDIASFLSRVRSFKLGAKGQKPLNIIGKALDFATRAARKCQELAMTPPVLPRLRDVRTE